MRVVSSWSEFEKHFDQVCKLEESCEEISTWDQGSWQSFFDRLSMNVILSFEGRLLAGMIVVSHVQDEAELLKICVDPNNRQSGIGRALVAKAVELLHDFSVEQFYLEVRKDNDAAISFYQSLGFLKAGERKNYYSNPICDAVLYRLQIS